MAEAAIVVETIEPCERQIAGVTDIDSAMRLGTHYAEGPIEWARRIGIPEVGAALRHLAKHGGEDRYRIAPGFARRILEGRAL